MSALRAVLNDPYVPSCIGFGMSRLRQISRFGNRDDVREGPYVGLDVIYQSLVADFQFDVVEITVFRDFWGDTVRPSTFSLLHCGKLRSCSLLSAGVISDDADEEREEDEVQFVDEMVDDTAQ